MNDEVERQKWVSGKNDYPRLKTANQFLGFALCQS